MKLNQGSHLFLQEDPLDRVDLGDRVNLDDPVGELKVSYITAAGCVAKRECGFYIGGIFLIYQQLTPVLSDVIQS